MLRIGEFARLGRVTVKTLRYYDAMGLLRPMAVDPVTGYRGYDTGQLEELSRILLLRDLGFALSTIAVLMRDPDRLMAEADRRRCELKGTIAADQRRLERLEALLAALARHSMPSPLMVRSVPDAPALTAREVVRRAGGRVSALFEQLEIQAARSRSRAPQSPFLLLHDGSDGTELDVEVCVPIRPGALGASDTRLVPGCAAAGVLVHRGPYARTSSLFEQLVRWAADSANAICGPMRVVYLRFGADQRGYVLPEHMLATDPRDYVTELLAPID